jgi:endonuclease/exonuclease/phosphatase (EEP) superfamily protein YafD
MAMKSTFVHAISGAALLMLAACATVAKEDRLLVSGPAPRVDAFDHNALRVLSWNMHKAKHADCQRDLARHAADNDLLLLQEAVLDVPIRALLEREGYSWLMANAFSVGGLERGVLIAARARPVDGRALRAFELLFPIPKSAIVTHYRLVGRSEQLAVANLHGINFTLGLGRFREQLEAVAKELKNHEGPVIFGGDFNTWSPRRHEVLGGIIKRLGLVEVKPAPDVRRRAFGQHLDHLFVRRFSVIDACSPEVKSSDHNPILVRMVSQCPVVKARDAAHVKP